MDIKSNHERIVKEFEDFNDWEERYAYIIKLGKNLPEYPEEFRSEKFKIDGCQSQVWMHPKPEDGAIKFEADSDAMIVKGLIAILLKAYSGYKPSEILSSPPEFLKKIGIDSHLSPTRKNGLGAMLKQINMYALALKTVLEK